VTVAVAAGRLDLQDVCIVHSASLPVLMSVFFIVNTRPEEHVIHDVCMDVIFVFCVFVYEYQYLYGYLRRIVQSSYGSMST